MFRYNPPSIGFARLSDAALSGNLQGAVPQPSNVVPSGQRFMQTVSVLATNGLCVASAGVPSPVTGAPSSTASGASVVTVTVTPSPNAAAANGLSGIGCVVAILAGALAWVV